MPVNLRKHAMVRKDIRRVGAKSHQSRMTSTDHQQHGGSFWTDAGKWLEGAYAEARPVFKNALELAKKVGPELMAL